MTEVEYNKMNEKSTFADRLANVDIYEIWGSLRLKHRGIDFVEKYVLQGLFYKVREDLILEYDKIEEYPNDLKKGDWKEYILNDPLIIAIIEDDEEQVRKQLEAFYIGTFLPHN